MTAGPAPAIVVIGCGNPTRGDDGVGPALIRRLAAGPLGRMAPAIRLYDAGTDGMAVMFAARGCRSLILVDACRSGVAPGAVFEVPASELAVPDAPVIGTHELRWEHALAAGRQIFKEHFPADVTVFLIEAGNLDFAIELSAPVAAAAERVAVRIEATVTADLSIP
jgi:hydrogenase maturation protease